RAARPGGLFRQGRRGPLAGSADALAALAHRPRPARGDDLQAGGVGVALAIIRPDAWNFPLLLHVLGAMLMVGALVLTATALVFAWRDGNLSMARLGYRSLLLGVIPAFILMRAGAEWIASKEGLENSDVSWIGIGFSTSDFGGLLIIIATFLAGFGMRRA